MPLDNNPPPVPQQLLPRTYRAPVTVDTSSFRTHALALQNWFYGNFFVIDGGYPIPMTFCNPMDALSEFKKLWGLGDRNPFKYLLALKDANGTPLYEPYPSNIRYPVITAKFKSIDPRIEQSYGTRKYRRINYPTISSDVLQEDLGNVTNSRMPMAWNFSWQVDHFCDRPDTQAVFLQYFMRAFKGSGGMLETWVVVKHPGYYGKQVCKLRVDGGIVNTTPDDPGEAPTEYRTTINLILEGYTPHLDLTLWPSFWKTTELFSTASLEEVDKFYENDLRPVEDNPNFNSLPNLPPKS